MTGVFRCIAREWIVNAIMFCFVFCVRAALVVQTLSPAPKAMIVHPSSLLACTPPPTQPDLSSTPSSP